MKIATLVFALCSLNYSIASRILFLFPSHSPSHLIVVKGLSTYLAEEGHDVTVVSPFPLDKPMKNYRDIKVEVPQVLTDLSSLMVKEPNRNVWSFFGTLLENLFIMGNGMLNKPEFKKMMNEEKFDLVVIGMFFNNYLLGVGDHFKCPTIMLSVSGPMTLTNLMVGNPLAVASVSHPFVKVDPKNFFGRFVNFLAYGSDFLLRMYLDYHQKINYK